jgi:hypothetical protein
LYSSVYNSNIKGLWYFYQKADGDNSETTNNTSHEVLIDGTGANTQNGNTNITNSTNAGQYNAIDYDNIGPVIAYNDVVSRTLRIAVGEGNGSDATKWTKYNLLPDTHPLSRNSGEYVSMKIDSSNGIHLAFYNSSYNTVVYAYLKDRTKLGSTPGTAKDSDFRVHTIDNVIQGGIWTDITVREESGKIEPFIVYGNVARIGNIGGARIAYRGSFTWPLNCPVTGADITGWEAVTMPSDYRVSADRLNIEAWPPTVRSGTLGTAPPNMDFPSDPRTYSAAVGYGSDKFRLAYFAIPGYEQVGVNP